MVQIAGFYDENAEPSGDFSPIPAGQYVAEIVDSEIVNVSKNDDSKGTCLKLTWKIGEGELTGRLVWQRLNMWFSGNEKKPGEVARIANQQFAAIRQACGKGVVQDTAELHFIPCRIVVKLKTDPSGQYAPQKEIGSVSALDSGTAFAGAANAGVTQAAPARPAPTQAAKPAASGALPWKRPA